jgi:transposase
MDIDKLDKKKLEELYHREKDSKAQLRLLALIHRKDGKTYQEIGDILRKPFTTIKDWIKRVEKRGLKGIYDEQKPGRPFKLTSEEFKDLEMDLAKSPKELGYKQDIWTTGLVRDHIKEKYNVNYGLRNVRKILHKAGFSPQKARPKHYKADKGEQEKFRREFEKKGVRMREKDMRSYVWTR